MKYRYRDGVLHWKWPLITGTRLTGLTAYRHDAGGPPEGESNSKSLEMPVYLQIFYGDISLNRVKDWFWTTRTRPNEHRLMA